MNRLNIFTHLDWHRWYVKPKKVFRNIYGIMKWSYQRITRGYCDADVWDLDNYFLELIPGTLELLSDKTDSYPSDIIKDCDEWKDFLKKVAHCFNQAKVRRELSDKYNKYTIEERMKFLTESDELMKEGFRLLGRIFWDLWW